MVQHAVREAELGGARIGRGPVAAVPRALALLVVRTGSVLATGLRPGRVLLLWRIGKDLVGLLRAGPEQHAAQPLDRGPFRADLVG